MKIKFYIFLFLLSTNSRAQNDTLFSERTDYVAQQKDTIVNKIVNTKDLKVDSLSHVIPSEFNPNFKEKYNNGSDFVYSYEKIKQRSWWERFKQAIIDFFQSLGNGPGANAENIFIKSFKVIGLIIFISLVVYLLIRFFKGDFNKFWTKKAKNIEIENFEIEKNIHQVDFPILIQQVTESKNYRLAIRYYYLWLLKKLSAKDIIDWHPEKTNSQYINEIQNDEIKAQFTYLSYVYNNIWYGEFTLSEDDFEKGKNSFLKILNQYKNE